MADGANAGQGGGQGTPPKYTVDEQTGESFQLTQEDKWDSWVATLTFVYLVLLQAFFFWLMLDFWIERYSILRLFYATEPSQTATVLQQLSKTLQTTVELSPALSAGSPVSPTLQVAGELSQTLKTLQQLARQSGADRDLPQELKNLLADPTFRLIFYTFIGGALGALVNSLRSLWSWHCDRKAFGKRYVWRYVTSPLVGATLAIFVFAILSGGLAVLGGSTPDTQKKIAMFAVGVLAGHASYNVFKWMDALANQLFQIGGIAVPDVTGKTQDEATQTLKAARLGVEAIPKESEDANEGKVIEQLPKATQKVASDTTVYVFVGKKKGG